MRGFNTLQNQPLDILLHIIQVLDHESLLRLRLVSQSLSHACTPYALRHVVIFLQRKRGEHIKDTIERLYTFEDNPELVQTFARQARSLTIHSTGFHFEEEGFIPRDSVGIICEGLRRFKSIKSLDLRWRYRAEYNNDNPDNYVFVIDLQDKFCLSVLEATGNSLDELALSPAKPRMSIPAPLLASSLGIRSFQIIHDESGARCFDQNFDQNIGGWTEPPLEEGTDKCPIFNCQPLPLAAIQKLILENPLERLHVVHGCLIRGFELKYIFPPRDSPSPLTTLTIKGLNLDRLSSLIPANSLCNLTHLTVQNRASHFKFDILWSSLKAARAELQTLVSCQMTYPLCVYLASYSGLRELMITKIERDADFASGKTSSAFFDDVLPQHAKTLRKLKVGHSPVSARDVEEYGTYWAFPERHDGRWGRALSKLTALTSLHIEPLFT